MLCHCSDSQLYLRCVRIVNLIQANDKEDFNRNSSNVFSNWLSDNS